MPKQGLTLTPKHLEEICKIALQASYDIKISDRDLATQRLNLLNVVDLDVDADEDHYSRFKSFLHLAIIELAIHHRDLEYIKENNIVYPAT